MDGMRLDRAVSRDRLGLVGLALSVAFFVVGCIVTVPPLVSVFARTEVGVAALGGAILQAALLTVVGWLSIRPYRIGVFALIACLLLAAVFASGIGILLNTSVGEAAKYVVPLVEEVAKVAVVVAVALMVCPRGDVLRRYAPMLGFALGYVVGSGFEIVEKLIHAVNTAVDAPDPGAGQIAIVMAPMIGGFGLHAFITAIAGAGVGLALTHAARWVFAPVALLIAIALHELWDNVSSIGWFAVPAAYVLIVAVFVVVRVMSGRAVHRSEAVLAPG